MAVQYIMVTTVIQEDQIKLNIVDFRSLKHMHHHLRASGLNVPTYTQFVSEIGVKCKDYRHPLTYNKGDDMTISIEAVHSFSSVPEDRSVVEIVASLHYAALLINLLAEDDSFYYIRAGPKMIEVLSSPNELIRPDGFNWNLVGLINESKEIMLLASLHDMVSST
jgi:hypothetical protein